MTNTTQPEAANADTVREQTIKECAKVAISFGPFPLFSGYDFEKAILALSTAHTAPRNARRYT